MNEHINKEKLFDYFAGKATALEKQQIEVWSREPAHEDRFYDWLDEWEQAHLQYTVAQPAALDRYRKFLYADVPNEAGIPDRHLIDVAIRSVRVANRAAWWVWAVAASISVVAGLFAFREPLLTQTYTTAYGETRTITLPDGSVVTLNANSALRVPRQLPVLGLFGRPVREVRLTGEALFSVAHTATDERFVVTTDNGPEVVVLGTEFTVFARPRGMKVVLNRGKVEVHYQERSRQPRQLTMIPGDLVTLSPGGVVKHRQLKHPPTNPAWTDHRFVFDKTPLTEVVAMIGENYGLTVELADTETGQLTLSGAYSAQNADELLRIVAEVLNIHIARQADRCILSQKTVQ